jgi:hypothetical protein
MAQEKLLEQKLIKAVRKAGGLALKFVSPGYAGMPDRLVLIAYGKIAFVEVKSPGKKPRKIQAARHKQLSDLGFNVYVLDQEDQIGGIIDAISAT